jgi:molybdopterin molybdotransferase
MSETDPLKPPPLSNDCFALPQGVSWTPVDEALEALRARLRAVTGVETVPLGAAAGRVLARDVAALRANPPQANTAVDGYGFAAAGLPAEGEVVLPLTPGRAAAGAPFAGAVPAGHALRILTGAVLPEGVDTVVLEEDTRSDGARVAFRAPLKPGANTRRAGEDVQAGAPCLRAGRVLTPADLALAAATGHGRLPVRAALRVGVLSTGDEIVAAGQPAGAAQTYDANRPMLLALLARFGHEAVDLGHVGDDRAALRAALDGAGVHAVLTSGGASAGDEDHVSALLRETGALSEWRIALKPGRPLALGLWEGMPVFGLPGNPVAAFTCTLIFARPALALLAGAEWQAPQGFEVPAGFAKRKKPGRREYLRARLRAGRAEVFRSEGSGRVSGLSWAEGLVELPDGAMTVEPGTPVRYIPFGSFGL